MPWTRQKRVQDRKQCVATTPRSLVCFNPAESVRCQPDLTFTYLFDMAGLADPVYAEAYVTVHQYDIVLDVTVINRTDATMQVVNKRIAADILQ